VDLPTGSFMRWEDQEWEKEKEILNSPRTRDWDDPGCLSAGRAGKSAT
jgi:hypothetical protein